MSSNNTLSETILPRPNVSKITSDRSKMLFTLENTNVSVANAIRRTILSDIPVIVIRTETHEINRCQVAINTSKTHNEMLLQRISSVPIHSHDPQFCNKYALEIDVANTGDNGVLVLTTEHFKLRIIGKDDVEFDKDSKNKQFLPESESQKVFPPCAITKRFIELANLRPAIGAIPGERIKLFARFEWASGKDSGMFVVGNAAYGYTVNVEAAENAWSELEKKLTIDNASLTNPQMVRMLATQKRDFYHIDARRLFVPDSFDFRVESFGVYENARLVNMSRDILLSRIRCVALNFESGQMPRIRSSETPSRGYTGVIESSMANSWDLILEGEDDTVGNMLSYGIMRLYYDTEASREITYCAFKKYHPYHTYGVLRIATRENDPLIINRIMARVCTELCAVLDTIVM